MTSIPSFSRAWIREKAMSSSCRRAVVSSVACSFVYCRCSRGSWYEPPSSPRCVLHLRDSAMRDAIHGRKYENPIMREPPLQPRFSSLSYPSPLPPNPPTRFCSRSDICLSYVFALRISSRAFPGEELPTVRIAPFNPLPVCVCVCWCMCVCVCVRSPQLSGEKDGR